MPVLKEEVREQMPVTLAVLPWMGLSYFLATPSHFHRAGLRTKGALRLTFYVLIVTEFALSLLHIYDIRRSMTNGSVQFALG